MSPVPIFWWLVFTMRINLSVFFLKFPLQWMRKVIRSSGIFSKVAALRKDFPTRNGNDMVTFFHAGETTPWRDVPVSFQNERGLSLSFSNNSWHASPQLPLWVQWQHWKKVTEDFSEFWLSVWNNAFPSPFHQKTTSKSIKRWVYVGNFLVYKLCTQCLKIQQVTGGRDGPPLGTEEEL